MPAMPVYPEHGHAQLTPATGGGRGGAAAQITAGAARVARIRRQLARERAARAARRRA